MVWFYTLIIVMGTFLAVLGITSTNVALPKMIAPLQTDIYGIGWDGSILITLFFLYITKKEKGSKNEPAQ